MLKGQKDLDFELDIKKLQERNNLRRSMLVMTEKYENELRNQKVRTVMEHMLVFAEQKKACADDVVRA